MTKRGIDLAVAFSVLIVLSPLLLMVTIYLLVAQGRPVFIKHRRLGLRGKSFPCFKFRTMVLNNDEVLRRHLADHISARAEWEATRKLKVDPRVTAIGRVLRTSSVDELPQMFNILLGHMSLVGPRPIVEAEVHHYGPLIQNYYRVRPGLTGPWQVSGRNDTSYARRVQMDVTYVDNRSLLQDVSIILKTIPAVVKARGSY